jgi:hypothetical protein
VSSWSQSLYLFVRRVIKHIVVIMKAYYSSTTYKILSNILLSNLTPHTEEITGEYPCWIRYNRSTTDHIFCIRQIFGGGGEVEIK